MAQSLLNFQYNIDTAKTLAANQGLYVLVVFCRSNCAECTRQYAIFNTTDFTAFLNENFIVVSNDIIQDPKTYVPYAQGLNGSALPFMVLIDPKSNFPYFARFNGLMDLNTFQIQYSNATKKAPAPSQQPPSQVVPSVPPSVDVVDEVAIITLENRAKNSANKAKYYAEQAATNKKAADAILTTVRLQKAHYDATHKPKTPTSTTKPNKK